MKKDIHPESYETTISCTCGADYHTRPTVKNLRIVTSAAYRMKSSGGAMMAQNQSKDPDNVHLWRMNVRRAEAELVRDSVLHVTGGLDWTRGGAELDQIKASLGHASVQTTERYVGETQRFTDAPADRLGLRVKE